MFEYANRCTIAKHSLILAYYCMLARSTIYRHPSAMGAKPSVQAESLSAYTAAATV